jgi:DNA-binding phage protein
MPLATTRYDVTEHLTTPELQAAYLEAWLEDGTPDEIARALEAIAHAGGDVVAIARSLGYKLALVPA